MAEVMGLVQLQQRDLQRAGPGTFCLEDPKIFLWMDAKALSGTPKFLARISFGVWGEPVR